MNQFAQIVLYPKQGSKLNDTLFTLCDEPEHPDPRDREEARKIFKSNSYGIVTLRTAPILEGPCDLFYAHCVNDWVVCIAIPRGWTARLLLPLYIRFLIGALPVVLITILVIFLICRRLNKPLLALAHAAEAVGDGDFSAPLPEVTENDEIGQVTSSFRRMQSELADYIVQMKATVAVRERAEGELQTAETIQKDLLPKVLPPFRSYPNVGASADLIPARGIGGDLYDVFPVDKERLAMVIGDVSDKGVPAALVMAVMQTLQHGVAFKEQQPELLIKGLNDVLRSKNDSNMFVTYWAGFLNTHSGLLTYSNAGHNPPLIKRANGSVEVLTSDNEPVIGVIPFSFTRKEVQLSSGDFVILYTDGVTEAFSVEEKMFGEERLIETVRNSKATQTAELLKEIESAVATYTKGAPQFDDLTLLVLQYEALQENVETITVPATPEHLGTVWKFVADYSVTKRFSQKERYMLKVAIEEVFANIVHHAYQGKMGELHLRCYEDKAQHLMYVVFADSGIPYNPLKHEDPDVTLPAEERTVGGLGVYIVKQYMDTVQYQYKDGMNILTIGKKYKA